MRAMVLCQIKQPLVMQERRLSQPRKGQLLIKVAACGICRTDRHILEGEVPPPKLPLILGHQIVGFVEEGEVLPEGITKGMRVGVGWLGLSCHQCRYCLAERENLCDGARFTGYHLDGGFAEYCLAEAEFVFPLPAIYSDAEAAPLLCAGLIGYRAWKMALEKSMGSIAHIGFYGFGASAELLIQLAIYQGMQVSVFTQSGNRVAQQRACALGARWAGSVDESPPQLLDAAIIFAPVGSLVPRALAATRKGARIVCATIHMSQLPPFAYSLLWGERSVHSVANLTRQDGQEFLALAPKIPIHTHIHCYSLAEANQAIDDLRTKKCRGAAVLLP